MCTFYARALNFASSQLFFWTFEVFLLNGQTRRRKRKRIEHMAGKLARTHLHRLLSRTRKRETARVTSSQSSSDWHIYILVMYRLSYCVCVLALCILFSIFLFGVQWGVREGITEGIIKKSKICRAFVREVTTIIKLALQTPPSLKERYAYRKKVISSYLTY